MKYLSTIQDCSSVEETIPAIQDAPVAGAVVRTEARQQTESITCTGFEGSLLEHEENVGSKLKYTLFDSASETNLVLSVGVEAEQGVVPGLVVVLPQEVLLKCPLGRLQVRHRK